MLTRRVHRIRLSHISLVAAALTFACIGLGGCYERVVGVQGPGADGIDVYEPNLKEPVTNPYTDPGPAPNKKYKGN